MKTKYKNLLVYLTIPLIISSLFLSSCCSSLDVISKQSKEKAESTTQEANASPTAQIDIAQEGSDGYYYEKGKPLFLSGFNSIDPGKDGLTFRWKTGDDQEITGEEASHVFDNIGEYTIELMVSDGILSDTAYKKIRIIESAGLITIVKEHKFSIEIEYTIENKGPADLTNIQCGIEVPRTQFPLQTVEKYSANTSDVKELTDDNGNLIYRFSLEDIAKGESASAKVRCDLIAYEFDYKDYWDDLPKTYGPDDKDLELFTKSEKYIDSDSPKIIEQAVSIVGNETNPYRIAEKLYNFVAGRLEYDFEKLKAAESLNILETDTLSASEILERDKGICADYSILYTALCRASGIPAQFIKGIPVFSILQEENKQLSNDHAWVKIKLPVYGWVPIDITSESGFMSYDCFLNIETFKSLNFFYESLTIEGEKYYPTGFYYNWDGDTMPDVSQKTTYRVSGIDYEDISVVAENEFLDRINGILSEYTALVNNVNSAHSENWIFNDPQEIAIEENFLTALLELSDKLKKFSYPQSFKEKRDNMVKISEEICVHKEAQINYMKNNNFESNIDSYNKFFSALDSLYNYYNDIIVK